jgi:small subunit ribosomal protein S6
MATKEAVVTPSPMMKEEKSKSVLGRDEVAAAAPVAEAAAV